MVNPRESYENMFPQHPFDVDEFETVVLGYRKKYESNLQVFIFGVFFVFFYVLIL